MIHGRIHLKGNVRFLVISFLRLALDTLALAALFELAFLTPAHLLASGQ